jgi:hypothetical protein
MEANIRKIKSQIYITIPVQEDLAEESPVLLNKEVGKYDYLLHSQDDLVEQIVASTTDLGFGIQIIDNSNKSRIYRKKTVDWDLELLSDFYANYAANKEEEWEYLSAFEETAEELELIESNKVMYEKLRRLLPI